MSSAVVSTSAALGRPFLFDDDPDSGGAPLLEGAPLLAAFARSGKLAAALEDVKKPSGNQSARTDFVRSTITNQKSTILPASIVPASRLEIRPAPEMVSSGIAALDSLTGGLPRGCLTEICGPTSSGRTSMMLAALAAATRRGEFCALLDANDSLDPKSAASAGIDLNRFLWVRCGEDSPRRPSHSEKTNSKNKNTEFRLNARSESEQRLEQLLRATDLLLESGGFGLIVLDLADLPPQSARRIPLTTWFRFRRAVEHKPTMLLAIEQQPIAGSCSSLLLQLGAAERRNSAALGAPERPKSPALGAPERCNSAALGAPERPKSPALGALERCNSAALGAAERRKSAAHGASHGEVQIEPRQAPEGRKKIPLRSEGPTPPTDNTLMDPWTDPPPTHARLLSGLKIDIEMIRSRLDRKPAHSVTFETKTAWAG